MPSDESDTETKMTEPERNSIEIMTKQMQLKLETLEKELLNVK